MVTLCGRSCVFSESVWHVNTWPGKCSDNVAVCRTWNFSCEDYSSPATLSEVILTPFVPLIMKSPENLICLLVVPFEMSVFATQLSHDTATDNQELISHCCRCFVYSWWMNIQLFLKPRTDETSSKREAWCLTSRVQEVIKSPWNVKYTRFFSIRQGPNEQNIYIELFFSS